MAFVAEKHPRDTHGKFVDVVKELKAMGGVWDAATSQWVVPAKNAPKLNQLLAKLGLNQSGPQLNADEIGIGPGKVPLTGSQKKRLLEMHGDGGEGTGEFTAANDQQAQPMQYFVTAGLATTEDGKTFTLTDAGRERAKSFTGDKSGFDLSNIPTQDEAQAIGNAFLDAKKESSAGQPDSPISDALAAMPPSNAPKKIGGHALLYGPTGLQRNFKTMSLDKLIEVVDNAPKGDPAYAVAKYWHGQKVKESHASFTDAQKVFEEELGGAGPVPQAAQDLLSYPELPSFGNSTSLANREDYRKKSAVHEQIANVVERWTGSGVDIEKSGDESRQSVRDDIAAGKLDEFVNAAANGPEAPTLWRIMDVPPGKEFEPGTQVKSRGLSAFTEKKEWAEAFNGMAFNKVLLEMEGGNGLPVAAISNTPLEAEWLVVNDFEVTEVVSKKDNFVHVKVKPVAVGEPDGTPPPPKADGDKLDAQTLAAGKTLGELTGGFNSDKPVKVKLPNGDVVVAKKHESVEKADKAHLSDVIADNLGFDVKPVKVGDQQTVTKFVEGQTGAKLTGKGKFLGIGLASNDPNFVVPDQYLNAPGAKQYALLTWMIDDHDTNGENWIVKPDGGIQPIDHDLTRFIPLKGEDGGGKKGPWEMVPNDDFVTTHLGVKTNKYGELTSLNPKKAGLTKDDLAQAREALDAAKPEFIEASREAWWDAASDRLAMLEDKLGIPTPSPTNVPPEDQAPDTIAGEDTEGDWPDFNDFVVKGSAGGTTGAKIVEDSKGNRYVLKDAQGGSSISNTTPAHLASEMQADKIYQAMGVPVPEFKAYRDPSTGGLVKVSEWIYHDGDLNDLQKSGDTDAVDNLKAGLREHFVVDAWLANWDVIGAGSEMPLGNVVLGKDEQAYRLDNGGALEFKGTGGKKNGFGTSVNELDTMRDASINPSTAKVFGSLTDAQVAGQIKEHFTGDKVEIALATVKDPTLRKKLDARVASMLKWADEHEISVEPDAPHGLKSGDKVVTSDGSTGTFLEIPDADGNWHIQMDGDPEDPSVALPASSFGPAPTPVVVEGESLAKGDLVKPVEFTDDLVYEVTDFDDDDDSVTIEPVDGGLALVLGQDMKFEVVKAPAPTLGAFAQPGFDSIPPTVGDMVTWDQLPDGATFSMEDESTYIKKGSSAIVVYDPTGDFQVGLEVFNGSGAFSSGDGEPNLKIEALAGGLTLEPGDPAKFSELPTGSLFHESDDDGIIQWKKLSDGITAEVVSAPTDSVWDPGDQTLPGDGIDYTFDAPPLNDAPDVSDQDFAKAVRDLGIDPKSLGLADHGLQPGDSIPNLNVLNVGDQYAIKNADGLTLAEIEVFGEDDSDLWTKTVGDPDPPPGSTTGKVNKATGVDASTLPSGLQQTLIKKAGAPAGLPKGTVLPPAGGVEVLVGDKFENSSSGKMVTISGWNGSTYDTEEGTQVDPYALANGKWLPLAESAPGAAPAPGTAVGDAPIGSTFQLPNTGGTVFELTDDKLAGPNEISAKVISIDPNDNPFGYNLEQSILSSKSYTDAIWTGGPDQFGPSSGPDSGDMSDGSPGSIESFDDLPVGTQYYPAGSNAVFVKTGVDTAMGPSGSYVSAFVDASAQGDVMVVAVPGSQEKLEGANELSTPQLDWLIDNDKASTSQTPVAPGAPTPSTVDITDIEVGTVFQSADNPTYFGVKTSDDEYNTVQSMNSTPGLAYGVVAGLTVKPLPKQSFGDMPIGARFVHDQTLDVWEKTEAGVANKVDGPSSVGVGHPSSFNDIGTWAVLPDQSAESTESSRLEVGKSLGGLGISKWEDVPDGTVLKNESMGKTYQKQGDALVSVTDGTHGLEVEVLPFEPPNTKLVVASPKGNAEAEDYLESLGTSIAPGPAVGKIYHNTANGVYFKLTEPLVVVGTTVRSWKVKSSHDLAEIQSGGGTSTAVSSLSDEPWTPSDAMEEVDPLVAEMKAAEAELGLSQTSAPATKPKPTKKFGKNHKQANDLGPTGTPASLKDLDLQPGDKIQMKAAAGSPILTIDEVNSNGSVTASGGLAKQKLYSKSAKPANVIKADGSPIALKGAAASAPAPAFDPKQEGAVFNLPHKGSTMYVTYKDATGDLSVGVLDPDGKVNKFGYEPGSYWGKAIPTTPPVPPKLYKPDQKQPTFGADVMDLNLVVGDKLQKKKGSPVLEIVGHVPPGGSFKSGNVTYTAVASGKGKWVLKTPSGGITSVGAGDTYEFAMKADGSPLKNASVEASIAPSLTKDQIKAKLTPGPAGSTIASIPNGTVVGTPDGKVGIKNDAISTTNGYTAFENVETGTKFSIKSEFTPQLMSEDTLLKKAAADLLKKAKASSAAQSTPAAVAQDKKLAKAAQKPGAPDKFKTLPATSIAENHLATVQADNSARMSASEKAACKSYTNGGYTTMNETLRKGGNHHTTLTTAKKIAALDSAIAGAKYNTQPLLLSRKTVWDPWKNSAKAGDVIQDNGFLSTSVSEGTWSGNIHMKILAHPGTKGLWANTTGASSNPGEREYILARGTQFHILKREESGGNTILWVETIP